MIPQQIQNFGAVFKNAGFQCYLVGGALRNMVAGINPTDFDFATDAQPHEVIALFQKVIPTGIKHGTVTVLFKGARYEVTTFRIETDYSDRRRPDNVTYTYNIYEDLKRRDFTINAMAYNIETAQLLDPHNGGRDLKNGIIRAIGDPEERFSEDGLRILRACRFAAQLNYKVEPRTVRGMRACLQNLTLISQERVRDELEKILLAPHSHNAFKIMLDTDILKMILPELAACRGEKYGLFPNLDCYDLSLKTCLVAKPVLELKLAALFHALGKAKEPGNRDYPPLSATIAGQILKRLRFANAIQEKVIHLIQYHAFSYDKEWSDGELRRFMAQIKPQNIQDLFDLRKSILLAAGPGHGISPTLIQMEQRLGQLLSTAPPLFIKDLAINGNTLIHKAGIKPGPQMGKILALLLEKVIENPQWNTEAKLLAIVKTLLLS